MPKPDTFFQPELDFSAPKEVQNENSRTNQRDSKLSRHSNSPRPPRAKQHTVTQKPLAESTGSSMDARFGELFMWTSRARHEAAVSATRTDVRKELIRDNGASEQGSVHSDSETQRESHNDPRRGRSAVNLQRDLQPLNKELVEVVDDYFQNLTIQEMQRPSDLIRLKVRNLPKLHDKNFGTVVEQIYGEKENSFYLKSAPYKLLMLDQLTKAKDLDRENLLKVLGKGESEYLGNNLFILASKYKNDFKRVMKLCPDETLKLCSAVKSPQTFLSVLQEMELWINQRIYGESAKPEGLIPDLADVIHYKGKIDFKNAEVDPLFTKKLVVPKLDLEVKIPSLKRKLDFYQPKEDLLEDPLSQLKYIVMTIDTWHNLERPDLELNENVLGEWLAINLPHLESYKTKIFETWQTYHTDKVDEEKREIELAQKVYGEIKHLITEENGVTNLLPFHRELNRRIIDDTSRDDRSLMLNVKNRVSAYAHGFSDEALSYDTSNWVRAPFGEATKVELRPLRKGWAAHNHLSVKPCPNGLWSAGRSNFYNNSGGGWGPGLFSSELYASKELAINTMLDQMIEGMEKSNSREAKHYLKEARRLKNEYAIPSLFAEPQEETPK